MAARPRVARASNRPFRAAGTGDRVEDDTFASNHGSSVLVANEGEPSDDYTRDPLGTVSVIDVQQALARR